MLWEQDLTRFETLSHQISDNFDKIIQYFGLDLIENRTHYQGICQLHSGDNPTALTIFKNDNIDSPGKWHCYTYNCHDIFSTGMFGLVRGLLSKKELGWEKRGDKTVSLEYTESFITDLLGESRDIAIDTNYIEKRKFVKLSNQLALKPSKPQITIHKSQVQKILDIPSPYYIKRGYSKEILESYDVGDCIRENQPMRYRAVVPVYDDLGNMIGCSGRIVFEQCSLCKMYHDFKEMCPQIESNGIYQKWKHSAGFKTKSCLYNYWKAKKHILETNTIILVESPGNVWRLEESGIHNSVAIFGTTLSREQQILIDKCGIFNVIIILDNDINSKNNVGQKAQKQIVDQLNKIYRVFPITISTEDIGGMSIQQVKSEISPQIEQITLTN